MISDDKKTAIDLCVRINILSEYCRSYALIYLKDNDVYNRFHLLSHKIMKFCDFISYNFSYSPDIKRAVYDYYSSLVEIKQCLNKLADITQFPFEYFT